MNFTKRFLPNIPASLALALITLTVVSSANAAATANCPFLANAPDQHVVVQGDTISEISAKFLQNRSCWSQVWDSSAENTNNRHLIHPGQVVYFDRAAGRLRLGKPGKQGNVASIIAPQISPSIKPVPSGKEAISTAVPVGAPEAAIKKLIESRLTEGSKVDSVSKAPFLGLYEVRIGNSLRYTDEKAQYFVDGHIFDIQSGKDLTQARMDDLNKIKFADLPFESAIKMVNGNGKRVIAIFEDPNCGYCKRFRHSLKEVDNITVYSFLYNILSDDSAVISKNIWCSSNRIKAWDDWMLEGKVAPTAPANCNSPNDKVFALGRKLNITGTPNIFFADGSRVPGAIEIKQLEAKLASLK